MATFCCSTKSPAAICILLILMLPAIKSDDNNTSHNEVLCPPDSRPDPLSPLGRCVCAPESCAPPATCPEPSAQRTKVASGVPGDCCDSSECVPPIVERNCTGDSCVEGVELDCPEDSYRLGGEGCQCLPTVCVTKACPRGTPKIVRPGTGKAGSCCPLYVCVSADANSTCTDDGTVMMNGSSWFRADCSRCRCESGLIFCDSEALPLPGEPNCTPLPPDCSLSRVPPGQCCPVCVNNPEELDTAPPPGSCVTGLYGKVVQDGETWQEDDCTTCTCKDGQRQCQAYMCEACANPQYEPGECCPRCNGSTVVTVPSHCPSLDNCSLRCVHGFVRDLNGCFTCHCQQDECLLDCPQGYAQDSHGNKLCRCDEPRCPALTCRKTCHHGYRTNKLGCEVCKCDACKPLDKCTKRCAHGLVLNAKNCVICKCIPHDNQLTKLVNSSDSAVGTPCISDNKVWRDDGETWFDGCRQCYCLAGREMCSLLSCPPAQCTNPVYNSSKDCCPSCPGTDVIAASNMVCQGQVPGKVHVEGDTWRVSPCVECVCQSGRALCHAASCPPTPCKRPLPPPSGECCPVCPPEQFVNNTISTSCERRHGETMWREGNCVSCLCDNERPACYTELCDHQVPCSNALQVKNQCCPICLDKVEGLVRRRCTVGNRTFAVGKDWRDDECTTCMCIAGGEISCTRLVCSANCPNPVKRPGVCCLVCTDDKQVEGWREAAYIVVLCVVAGVAVLGLGVYATRQCKQKRHQLNLHHYGCPPPQYTQYKYVPAYETPRPAEKSAFTPL